MLFDADKYSGELCEVTAAYFDEAYYLEQYPDIKEAPISPFEHYLNYGWCEGRNPSPHFDTANYLSEYADVAESGMNPLYHYVVWGQHEGRSTCTNQMSVVADNDVYQTLQRVHVDGGRSPDYAPRINAPVLKDEHDPKVIAFYLPQFHPFKENNEWWGKGFTEWSNVAKTIPQFKGHYQPRLPSDLGYYDLRLPEVMAEQIDMAKNHGVDGFCFHYYWFAGHRLMERPIEQYLEHKENLDFPFCLCWANENWSRRWDGSENDILIAQEHSEEDNEAAFYDLLRHFKDKRYIRVEDKPFIVIYRPDIIPNIKGLTEQWRRLAKKEGLKGLHLVATNSFGFTNYKELGFDAIVEFPPHGVAAGNINAKLEFYNGEFSGNVYDYQEVVNFSLDRLEMQKNEQASAGYYPTVMTEWDNSARKPGKGNVFFGATPAKFHGWLSGCYEWSKQVHPKESRFVFVNAWNEWAEGTYLEPDKKYGYAYLNAVRSAINEAHEGNSALQKLAQKTHYPKKSDTVVVAHVFYEDLVDEISDHIQNARKEISLDVAISIPKTFSESAAKKLVKRLKPVALIVSENRGRDVWPFIQTIDAIKDFDYKYGLKIHSKKSTHLKDGVKWRKSIYQGLLGKEYLQTALNKLDNVGVGIVSPDVLLYKLEGDTVRDNIIPLKSLERIYNCPLSDSVPFVAGTMFWFNFPMITKILNRDVNKDLFGPELGAIDGTVAHSFERFIPSIADMYEFKTEGYATSALYTPY